MQLARTRIQQVKREYKRKTRVILLSMDLRNPWQRPARNPCEPQGFLESSPSRRFENMRAVASSVAHVLSKLKPEQAYVERGS